MEMLEDGEKRVVNDNIYDLQESRKVIKLCIRQKVGVMCSKRYGDRGGCQEIGGR